MITLSRICILYLTIKMGDTVPFTIQQNHFASIVNGGPFPTAAPPPTTLAPPPPTTAPITTTLPPLTPAPTTAAPTTAAPTTAAPTTLPPTTIPPPTPPPTTIPPTTAAPTTTLPPTTAAPTTTTTATTTTTRPPTPLPTLVPIPQIDPRFPLGETGEVIMKFGEEDYAELPLQLDEYDNGVNFPRDKRQTTVCGCYTPQQCSPTGNTDGTGLIDFRIVGGDGAVCTSGLRYCCLAPSASQISCGSRLANAAVYTTQAGQARYGDYPWMVVLLTTNNTYVGGGVVIDAQFILTTAHRITPYTNGTGMKARLGEWDAQGTYEQYPYRDFSVARVWIHESFNPNTLQNDVALIRIAGGITSAILGIVPICMPTAGQNFEGQRCWVAGWGKDTFGVTGTYQNVLRNVDVPVIAPAACEATLRTTRLGTAYLLDRASFICAGGEVNKDACTGDGGSGLVCEVSSGRWVLAGLVAWGLGCAAQGVPAAYVNVVNYLPWIQARQTQ